MSIDAHRRRAREAKARVDHYLSLEGASRPLLRSICPDFRHWDDELADQLQWLKQNDPDFDERSL